MPSLNGIGRVRRGLPIFDSYEEENSQNVTCSAADSRAKISALLAKVRVSLASALACGESGPGCLAKCQPPPATSSLRTSPLSAPGDSERSSLILPRSGTYRGGTVYPLLPSAPLTGATDSSSWPTATASDEGRRSRYKQGGTSPAAVRTWPTPTCSEATGAGHRAQGGKNLRTVASEESVQRGPLNPAWIEQLMGFPEGWTDGQRVQENRNTSGSSPAVPRVVKPKVGRRG